MFHIEIASVFSDLCRVTCDICKMVKCKTVSGVNGPALSAMWPWSCVERLVTMVLCITSCDKHSVSSNLGQISCV